MSDRLADLPAEEQVVRVTELVAAFGRENGFELSEWQRAWIRAWWTGEAA